MLLGIGITLYLLIAWAMTYIAMAGKSYQGERFAFLKCIRAGLFWPLVLLTLIFA